jgi:hypothetical protein
MSNQKLKSSALAESPTRVSQERLRISQYDKHSSPEIAPHLYIQGSNKKRNLHTTTFQGSAGHLKPTHPEGSHTAPQKSQPFINPQRSSQNSKFNSRPESPNPRPSKPKQNHSEQKSANNNPIQPKADWVRSADKEVEVQAQRPTEIENSAHKRTNHLSHSPLQGFNRGNSQVRGNSGVRETQGLGVEGGGNPLARSSSQLQVVRGREVGGQEAVGFNVLSGSRRGSIDRSGRGHETSGYRRENAIKLDNHMEIQVGSRKNHTTTNAGGRSGVGHGQMQYSVQAHGHGHGHEHAEVGGGANPRDSERNCRE